MTALTIGIAFGRGVVYMMDLPYEDPRQGSPGMAAFGGLAFGVLAALLILPVVAGVIYWLALRHAWLGRGLGCLLAAGLPVAGAFVGAFLGLAASPYN